MKLIATGISCGVRRAIFNANDTAKKIKKYLTAQGNNTGNYAFIYTIVKPKYKKLINNLQEAGFTIGSNNKSAAVLVYRFTTKIVEKKYKKLRDRWWW